MSVHLMCHMAFLTPSERRFLEGVSELAYCNPFTPRRIECERRVLGADFVEGEAVWSLDVNDPYKPLVNGWKVYDRTEGLIQDLRGRLADTPKAGEKDLILYEDAALYVLYHRHLTPISHAMFGPPGTRRPSKRWGFYSEFRRGWENLLEVAGVEFPSKHQAPHLFACFSQIRRASQHIFLNIIGGSLSVGRLRAAVWESIFTCDMRRYRAVLYGRMGDFTTLITGPSGTGKELVARAIALSRYIRFDEESNKFDGDPAESFYAVNLAALSPTLIESELFGHRRGSFTGAVENRKGWFETCPALGTVFLDEIGELDPSIQVKLLRVIETRTFQAVGDTATRRFEGKIMAATNRDLGEAMRRGAFREDLYYRLCSDQVRTPPLADQIRESPDALHELIVFTAQRVTGEEDAELARQVEQWVRGNLPADYPWPGNYRELEQCVRNVLIRRSYEPAGGAAGAGEADMLERMQRGDLTAEDLLRYYITLVYSKTGSYQETARRLALDRRTVKSRLDRELLERLGGTGG